MATRIIYLLRDSVTGLYYCSRGNGFYTWDGDTAYVDPNCPYHSFAEAVIHTTENSVKDGQKKRAREFKDQLLISDEDAARSQWVGLVRELARERQDLPFFGIEIVTLTISDDKA